MSRNSKHSYIRFYPSDWKGGLAGYSLLVEAVYFRLCLHTWDTGEPVSAARQKMLLAELEGQGPAIIDALVDDKKLFRDEDGAIYSPRAMIEAQHALEQWQKKSDGGKKRALMQDSLKSRSGEPRPKNQSQEPESLTRDVEGEGKPSLVAGKATHDEKMRVVSAWNAMSALTSGDRYIAKVEKLTDKRSTHLGARIAEHGVETIIEAIATIPENNFLTGGGERGWKAHFNWLLQPDTCAKLIEGGYAQGAGKRSSWR